MKKFGLSILPAFLGVAITVGAATQASATIYNYTGSLYDGYGTGDYVTASVDLNCSGPCAAGNYIYSSGISSFSLTTTNSNTDTQLFTLSTGTPGAYSLYVDYLTLDNTGQVTNWSLDLQLNSTNSAIVTYGNDNGAPSNSNAGTYDYSYSNAYDVYTPNVSGTWQVAAVPEPSTWAMMLLGFAGVGFMAYRRSCKDQGLALAAA
jgi:hypothetical protein